MAFCFAVARLLATSPIPVAPWNWDRGILQSAGAARQYLGRLGKVELGQVGVALGYYKEGLWAMGDAEVYLPEVWCDDAHAAVRRRGHIPAERTCATKQALGLA